ncbi:sigma factor RpoE regulatory protein RseC [Halorhodospira halochloris]|uniref:Sigma factor RpoE regulatory protein RseC n=1 Tax=Halorhodospira halochloris TaxID=1052 RepID=A0A110B5A4_HALHR|nr:SoxR reducing system RseC family protein [Halorhodospira halochloris]MBK1652651.1 hypothetical protein [Halorhodospira halochloris]BAU57895.1 sigma factor RpoE regulatory protein RseC [Halorhodospira halochloris]
MSECLQREAVVAEVHGGQARIEADRPAACGACSARMACGVSVLERTRGNPGLWVENTAGAEVGETVTLEIGSGDLLTGAMLVYLLPLAFMVAAALGADLAFGLPSWLTAISAGIGLIAGFAVARLLLNRCGKDANQVRLKRRNS